MHRFLRRSHDHWDMDKSEFVTGRTRSLCSSLKHQAYELRIYACDVRSQYSGAVHVHDRSLFFDGPRYISNTATSLETVIARLSPWACMHKRRYTLCVSSLTWAQSRILQKSMSVQTKTAHGSDPNHSSHTEPQAHFWHNAPVPAL